MPFDPADQLYLHQLADANEELLREIESILQREEQCPLPKKDGY